MRTKIDFFNDCAPKSKNCFKKLFNVISGKPKFSLDFDQNKGFSCRASTSSGPVSMFWGFPSNSQEFRASSLVTRLHLLKEAEVSRNIIIFYQNELLNLGFKEIGGQDIRNVRADVCDIIQPAIFNKFIDVLEKVNTDSKNEKYISC